MVNARIMGTSWADDATITATSEALDADNLKDTDVRKVWRSTGPSGSPAVIADQDITIDFGEAKEPTWLFIDGLNNHRDMVGTVTLSDDNFSTTKYTANLDVLLLQMMQHFFPADTVCRYMRITLSDPTNSDDYIEAGRIKVGQYFAAPNSKNVAIGPSLSFVERGELIALRGGGFRSEQRTPARRLEVSWQWAHDDDNWTINAESFASLLENIGYRDDVVISVYPEEGTDREYRHAILGRMVENSGLQGHTLIKSGSDVVLYSSLNIAVVESLPRAYTQRLPLTLARYIYGSPVNTTGVTTARTTDLWLPNASGTYVQYGNGEVGIVDGDAVWCQPAATNYTDGTDDLSGGPETVDLTSAGTGNYTLSVIGTAAVTVAAGTAVGTGFGQATEGSPVTFNLSSAGTVTLTLDSGSLDTIGSSAAKQIEKNAFATSFIPTPAGTPVAISATQPVVPWPSGLVNDFVLATTINLSDTSVSSNRLFIASDGTEGNRLDIFHSSSGRIQITLVRSSSTIINAKASATFPIVTDTDLRIKVLFSAQRGVRIFVGGSLVLSDTETGGISSATDEILLGNYLNLANSMLGTHRNVQVIKVAPNITDAEVLAL